MEGEALMKEVSGVLTRPSSNSFVSEGTVSLEDSRSVRDSETLNPSRRGKLQRHRRGRTTATTVSPEVLHPSFTSRTQPEVVVRLSPSSREGTLGEGRDFVYDVGSVGVGTNRFGLRETPSLEKQESRSLPPPDVI